MMKFLIFLLFFSLGNLRAQVAPVATNDIELEDVKSETKVEFTPENQGVGLSLTNAIEQGLRLNFQERIRSYTRESLELYWDKTFYSFWFPSPNLFLSNQDQNLHRISPNTSNGQQFGTTTKSGQASIGMNLGDFTVFNWGRDYLLYKNAEYSFTRGKQVLDEQRRKLKFNVIRGYFNLVRLKQIQKIKREQLRHTSFIYRLAKERVLQRKISKQDYYQARGEFLRSQTEYQQAQFDVTNEQQNLANLLGENLQTAFNPEEVLQFKAMNVPLKDAIDYSLTQSPTYRTAKLEFDNSERFYEHTLRDNLPLPKITTQLGTYSFNNNREGGNTTYQTYPGNSNVELVASINMTWDLWGGDGLFNSRRNKHAYIDKKIAEINYFNARRELEVKMRMSYNQIKFLENQIQISSVQLDNANKNFDVILDNFVAGSSTFADLKNAINTLVNSGINVENSKYEHLNLKLELSDNMGLEDFPGERFENLALGQK
jgi:outer membrane protein TolC